MPEARVATHPPTDENSLESGSCPNITPYFSNSLSKS